MSTPKYELVEKIISQLEDNEEVLAVTKWAYQSTLLSMIADYIDCIHPDVFGEIDMEIIKKIVALRFEGPQ